MLPRASGFNGNGIVRVDHMIEGARFEWVAIVITALMFPLLVVLLRRVRGEGPNRSGDRLSR